jgi:hypothetical protein
MTNIKNQHRLFIIFFIKKPAGASKKNNKKADCRLFVEENQRCTAV